MADKYLYPTSGTRRHMLAWAERALRRSGNYVIIHSVSWDECLRGN